MNRNLVKIKRKRVFADELKRKIVDQYEKGEMTVLELEKFYNIGNDNIYNWIYKYSNYNKKSIQVVEMKDSSGKRIKELEAKIKELERIIGTKQINIDFLEKMIEIAKKDYNIDIKKNYSTLQSNGSGKIKSE